MTNNLEIFQCIYDRDINALDSLIRSDANINVQDHINYNTPLMFCIMNCYVQETEMLLEAGANVNILNRNGENALMLLIKNNFCNVNIFKMLIEKTDDLLYEMHQINFIGIIYYRQIARETYNDIVEFIISYAGQKIMLDKCPLLYLSLKKYKLLTPECNVEFEHLHTANDLNLF